ncbi:aldo/keto reductase [Kushneria aurantia]|uniref:Aldo/keto reductase n=1 Tax=Kushneria aurantia TaxID=504092 RepID=A0ABV6FYQ7_9GAMM|nr:aldo/keto reductase [Kushneria aurantia]
MRFELPGKMGLGTAPLGNMYEEIPDERAMQTLQTAWEEGIRYFDTAPQYGAGLSEMRLGAALADEPRANFVISTKVGRLLLDETEEKSGIFANGRPNRVVFDYSESAALRSIEESLKRLDTDRIDIAWIHDCAEDAHGSRWEEVHDQAMNGAAKALTRLRDEGVIKAWGLGVNRVEACTRALEKADPDGFLLAGRYSLLDHDNALTHLLPECERRGARLVIGGAYNSGILAGGEHYNYKKAPDDIRNRAARLRDVCERFGVDVRAVALQFSAAPACVASVIPGTTRPERITENLALMDIAIPGELWQTLWDEQLISMEAPIPGAAS